MPKQFKMDRSRVKKKRTKTEKNKRPIHFPYPMSCTGVRAKAQLEEASPAKTEGPVQPNTRQKLLKTHEDTTMYVKKTKKHESDANPNIIRISLPTTNGKKYSVLFTGPTY